MSDSYGFSLSVAPYPVPQLGEAGLHLAGAGDQGQSSVVLGFGRSAEGLEKSPVPQAEPAPREIKKLSIVLPKSVHQSAKLLALREDITLTSMIVDLLQQRINAAGL